MDDAYTAGVIDSDGCIRLAKGKRGVVTVVVEVTMSFKALPLLRKLHHRYGGKCIRIKRDLRPTRAVTHSWRLIGRPASAFLRLIRPHLIVKGGQADLAIWLQDTIDRTPRGPGRGGPWTQELKEAAERARRRMAELNRTGPERVGSPGKMPFAIFESGEWVSPQMTFDPLPVPFMGSWPAAGEMVDGLVYALPVPSFRPRTGVTASSSSPGLLPTPIAADGQGGPRTVPESRTHRGKDHGPSLRDMANLLPTPTARDGMSGPGHAALAEGSPDLRTLAPTLLPTPQSRDGGERGGRIPSVETATRRMGEEGRRNLDDAVALLPTPTTRDTKGPNQRRDPTCLHGALLPTPRASDGEKGGPNQRGSSGDQMLPSAVMQLLPASTGAPTPPPSPAGRPCLDVPLPPPPSEEPEASPS